MDVLELRLFWHRAGPLCAIAALGVTGAAIAGCGGGGATPSGTGTVTAAPAGDAPIVLDATPDPTGTTLYFTAVDPTAGPGVFKVPADGSKPAPTTVQAGDPFAAPFGIAIGSDGGELYVADPGATDPASNGDRGVIFSLPVGGGAPAIVSGSALSEARGLEVRQENGADVIYFTGHDTTSAAPGVFKIPASGGTITTVAEGDPFQDPSGIAIAADGTLYVADTVASPSQAASIIKVDTAGVATTFLADLRVGYPCGVALTKDDATLLISALDPTTRTDVVLSVEIATTTATPLVPMAIAGNTEGAGLHRAKGLDVFAWADTSAGPSGGRVYLISLK